MNIFIHLFSLQSSSFTMSKESSHLRSMAALKAEQEAALLIRSHSVKGPMPRNERCQGMWSVGESGSENRRSAEERKKIKSETRKEETPYGIEQSPK
jgi:hypothetical protein